MTNNPKILMDNLHESFMSLHEERMKELNSLLENFGKEKDEEDEVSNKLSKIAEDLEDLLK